MSRLPAGDQIPLYVGIPLAVLCIGVTALVLTFAVVIWKEYRRS